MDDADMVEPASKRARLENGVPPQTGPPGALHSRSPVMSGSTQQSPQLEAAAAPVTHASSAAAAPAAEDMQQAVLAQLPQLAGVPLAATAAAPLSLTAAPAVAASDAAPAAAAACGDGAPAERPRSANGTAAAPAPADTYCARELRHKEREATGELGPRYVYNDGSPDGARLLVGLKNVFSKCLPNMPKTYIARLVFDRRHRSVVILRNGTTVIAGITYRPFHDRRFAEIAFCAVAQSLQVAGFGSRLMNWTKHYARQRDACEYFLTYADNAAVGYFAKQGFTKAISMPRDRWHGFIKDYDGGTLMECAIHPSLPFTELPEAIAAQRAALDAAVRQYSSSHVVHPGLARWREGGGPGSVPPLPLASIPGVLEAGWVQAAAASAATPPGSLLAVGSQLLPPTREALAALMRQLLGQLEAHEEMIWPFLHPVDPDLVPDYAAIVSDPIDLSTIRRRLDGGNFYATLDIFAADVQRMFANAKLYNAADTPYYKHAHKLAHMFQQWLTTAVHSEPAAAAAPPPPS